jgi:radical SAM protein with 4Fe4S-binding SPASM domain
MIKRYNWTIGISYDGINNTNTRRHDDIVLNNIKMCTEMYRAPGIITVVDNNSVKNLSNNYEHFKESGIQVMQFNTVFQAADAEIFKDNAVDIYIEELAKLFDKWLYDPGPLFIRNFEEFLGRLINNQGYICVYQGSCFNKWVCIDVNGDILPCDRWYTLNSTPDLNKFIFGNVATTRDITKVHNTDGFKELVAISSARKNRCKNELNCEIYDFCNGGCNMNAIVYSGGLTHEDTFCKITKKEMKLLVNTFTNLDITKVRNPRLLRQMTELGYRSLDVIKESIEKHEQRCGK